MEPKPILKSKTAWLGIIVLLISLGETAQGDPFVQSHPQAVSIIGTIVGALILIARWLTSEPVTLKSQERNSLKCVAVAALALGAHGAQARAPVPVGPQTGPVNTNREPDGQGQYQEMAFQWATDGARYVLTATPVITDLFNIRHLDGLAMGGYRLGDSVPVLGPGVGWTWMVDLNKDASLMIKPTLSLLFEQNQALDKGRLRIGVTAGIRF